METKISRQIKYQQKRLALGLCRQCGNKARVNSSGKMQTLCEICNDKQKGFTRKWQKSLRVV